MKLRGECACRPYCKLKSKYHFVGALHIARPMSGVNMWWRRSWGHTCKVAFRGDVMRNCCTAIVLHQRKVLLLLCWCTHRRSVLGDLLKNRVTLAVLHRAGTVTGLKVV